MSDPPAKFVSRAGLKVDHALRMFELDVTGFVCADFGCNVGGFTDCLLQRGAAKVFAIDTGYGVLDWNLRNDPRVVVMERTNALHAAKPQAAIDLIVIDLGWTKQRHAIPAALRWLDSQLPPPSKGGGKGMGAGPDETDDQNTLTPALSLAAREREQGFIVSLIKPHYEVSDDEKRMLRDGTLAPADAQRVFERVISEFPTYGAEVLKHTTSPITGGKSGSKNPAAGNVEYLVLARPIRP